MLTSNQTLPEEVLQQVDGALAQLRALQDHLPASFDTLRREVHALSPTTGISFYGPHIVRGKSVYIEIVDLFMNPLATFTFIVPQEWHDEPGW
jgi:hypothetical protein